MKEAIIFVVLISIVFLGGIAVGDFWVSKIINKEYENGIKLSFFF